MEKDYTVTITDSKDDELSNKVKANALLFLKRHIDPSLRSEYLQLKTPKELWDALKGRFGNIHDTLLPELTVQYNEIRLLDYKKVQLEVGFASQSRSEKKKQEGKKLILDFQASWASTKNFALGIKKLRTGPGGKNPNAKGVGRIDPCPRGNNAPCGKGRGMGRGGPPNVWSIDGGVDPNRHGNKVQRAPKNPSVKQDRVGNEPCYRIRTYPCINRAFPLLAFQRTQKPLHTRKDSDSPMTIKPAVRVSDGKLIVKNRTVLTGLPDNVVATSGSASGPAEGVFLGAAFEEGSSRHVTSLGTFQNGVRFMACFRFKLWWMAQKMGRSGRDVPLETQFLLVETQDGSHLEEDQVVYAVFLPLIEGPFRASLQGNSGDELELCLESGDVDTKAASFSHAVFVHAGTDPFATITEAVRAVKVHLKTFRQRHEKKLPGVVDYFGWCTWDAFYQEVTQEGVEAGLKSLTAGGAPPKFVIIDDGWQSVAGDQDKAGELQRLTGIKENSKFQHKDDGIMTIVNIAKEKYGLKYVYVWHAITGYWGGVRPGTEYGSVLKYPDLSKGVMENEPAWKTDMIRLQGLGLVNPKSVYKFYNELHSYLASAGVDGVKVDVQCVLETLGAGLGGRVELTRQYHQALDASVSRNFEDNGIIACMSHNTDALYCEKQTAVVRASDDFYPRDPMSHTIHVAAVAYNSVFLGEFMLPDWDMFHSLHPAAEYHASARALSGGPVYVSDAPGKHDFELLKKMVLPDGSVLRARLPGRPTRDCLFTDPARDGVSLLKIWNMNKYTGVVGVYNCQGAAWSSLERKNAFHETKSDAITGYVRGRDIHLIKEAATDPDWNGDCAVYCNRTGELVTLPHNAAMPISLKVLEHEIFTVSPIRVLAPGVRFAPLGLVDMYNAGGAIEDLRYEQRLVSMEVRGCGKFGVYSSEKPMRCCVGTNGVDFSYDSASGLVTLILDHMPEEGKRVQLVEVEL